MSWLLIAMLVTPAAGCVTLALIPTPLAHRISIEVATVFAAATLVLAVLVAATDSHTPGAIRLETNERWVPELDLRFHIGVDGVSVPLILLTALLVLLCCLYSIRIRPEGGRGRALFVCILLLEVGMLGTFVSLDLLLFFIFFELVLIPMWFVIAWWGDPHDKPGRTRAATTFILYTLIGSAIMLLGFLLVHARTGTFDIVELTALGGSGISTTTQVLAAVAIVGGLAVKAPMWPLHTWLPDAHWKAPTIGSVLLAGVLLKMGTYGMVRIAVPVVPEGMREIAPWIGGLAVVGIIYGSLACLAQRDLKRLVAYSSVGHMGFVLLGIASMSPQGINGALYANIAHGLITGLLFFLAGAVKDRYGSSDLKDLGEGLYRRVPRLGWLLAFASVASLGLPGLAGFWGEMLSMAGAFRPDSLLDRPYFLLLMALAGFGAVLTAVYLLTLVRHVCQGGDDPPARTPGVIADVTVVEAVAWAPLVLLIVILGVWPGLLLEATDASVGLLVGAR